MDSVPLIPRSKILPSLDVSPVIREYFQEETEFALRAGSSKKQSKTIWTSLQCNKSAIDELESPKIIGSLNNLLQKKEILLDYSGKVLQAYSEHEEESKNIRDAEKNVFETHSCYLKRQAFLLENKTFQELYLLKRQPLFKALDANHVKKYKLLEGEAALPPSHQAHSDFRVKNFGKLRKRLDSLSQDSVIMSYVKRGEVIWEGAPKIVDGPTENYEKSVVKEPKVQNSYSKKAASKIKGTEIFRAEPKIVLFTGYKPGEIYATDIEVKNISKKGLFFQVKPMPANGPFVVYLKNPITSKKLFPGLSFQLAVEFSPKSLDIVAEDIYISIEEGHKLLIPLVAYLEPPILKTHKDINEFTKVTAEKIASSCVECGLCFTGDTKVTKLRFKCYRGSGEFFIMSSENWNRNYVNSVTNENLLEIPPFRVYPVYFNVEKNDVIDLFVEFSPKNSGTHVENIMIACDNGEVRSLDLLGDAVGWHSYYFSFEDDLLKDIPVNSDDDFKVKYFMDFCEITPTGTVQKSFGICNHSSMPFEFQWKIREVNSSSNKSQKYLKLSKNQVKIEPESGTLEPSEICDFNVSISFKNADEGEYRMVLSLYVLNLPYQCIEEDNTIIQPTGLVRNLYSQSLYGEEEFTIPSPELMSLQGTYESLQESIKSYVEYQSKTQMYPKNDFCRTTCIPNPGLCAKPLKKSKTFFNIGDNHDDEGFSCVCRGKPEEANSESCASNEKIENEPKTEIIWDFVDILVDEVELWVEVSSVKVNIEPQVLNLDDFVEVGNPPLRRSIRVINYSRTQVTCKWTKLEKRSDDPDRFTGNIRLQVDAFVDDEKVPELDSSENYIAFPIAAPKILKNNKECPDKGTDDLGCVFAVPGLSDAICNLNITADYPGKFSQKLILVVNDGDLRLALQIQGTAVAKYLSVSPHLLNFKIVKQGARTHHRYEIKNEYVDSIRVKTNRYNFDVDKVKFFGTKDHDDKNEFMLEKGTSVWKTFYVDARKTGIKCSILDVTSSGPNDEFLKKEYLMTLGEVRVPVLGISAARFHNAILAPTGMMYVGEKLTSKIILRNRGRVNTIFDWGPPYGCHSRKIKVVVRPETGRIDQWKKLILEVELTPLDEGIIDHCYVPCYFCRSAKPLVLSIVGIVEKLHVTFEIIDSKNTFSAREISEGMRAQQTLMRIHWPTKIYDPNLGETFRREDDILNMRCKCFEVEEEVNRAFPPSKPGEKSGVESSSVKMFKVISFDKENKFNFSFSSANPEKTLSEENYCPISSKSVEKKSAMENCVQKFGSKESFMESLHLAETELEFTNVPFSTPVTKQFVIRNETPICTQFSISVQNFGKHENHPENNILAIKKKVFGCGAFSSKGGRKQNCEPLLLEVNPAKGDFLGREAVCINVTAIGNTWGEYRDNIVCQIKGVQTFYLKVRVQIVGPPFHFPMFDTYADAKPVLRFQPVSPVSEPATRNIRVVNRSAIPITVCWFIFLTRPLIMKDEELEESVNLCIESNANLDSNHSEESTKSVKVYIPKNISESSSTFRNMLEMRDYSQNSGTLDSFGKGDNFSEKNETQNSCEIPEKVHPDGSGSSFKDEARSESQPFMFRIDIHNFQVNPKELSFEPFEEKKLTVTFDPRFCKAKNSCQEFRAVLMGCIKLRPCDESSPGIFSRPSGMNFLTEVMEFNAVVETTLLSFDILKGDLQFYLDANEVIKSPSKKIVICRTYLLRNNNQKPIKLKIDISPGSIFRVAKVETVSEILRKYDPEINIINIISGEYLKVELECSVTYKGVIYAYEQLKLNRKKDMHGANLEDTKTTNTTNEEDAENSKAARPRDREPWCRYFAQEAAGSKPPATSANSSLEPKDSFRINLNRMSSKSDSTVCYDYTRNNYYAEIEGENLILPSMEETPERPKIFQHVVVVEEEISFVQRGLINQTINAELHLSFPALRISPKSLDMGNVYIGETSVRYFSLINLTGFPTDFKVKSKCNVSEFAAKPLTGIVPSANYRSDIGKTITLEFTPGRPGYFTEIFQIYCNENMEFDCYEMPVSGVGLWNEKYKKIKFETETLFPVV